jgi:hypothetical protein
VSTGTCPLQRGNCATFHIGCITFDGVPAPGTYSMRVIHTPPANTSNPQGYAPCQGGSACQSEVATITVSAGGSVQATVTSVYPDGFTLTTPSGGSFAGTAADPIVFHLFGLGSGSCDSDGDADDHLTGSPSSHCGYPEGQEAGACQPFPWSCAFAAGGTTTTTTSSTSTSSGGVTSTSTSSGGTSTGSSTSTSTSSTSNPSTGGPADCGSKETITWPFHATGSDSRSKHVHTIVAGGLSATLSGSGTTDLSLTIVDANGQILVSRTGHGGSITVSVASVPARSSIRVNETISFADTSSKSNYTLAVTHC